MMEVDWQRCVVNHAQRAGWLVYFIPDAMWRRAFKSKIPQHLGDRGFPDLILVKDRVLFRELKRNTGKLSEHQKIWREAIINAGGDYDVWRPENLDTKVIPTLWDQNPS